MSLTHDDVLDLLPELLRGGLAHDEARAVEAHLGSCAVCAEARDTLTLLASVPGVADVARHPTRAEIVRYAMDRGALEPERARSVTAHVAGCPTCRDQVRRIGAAERAATASPIATWLRQPWLRTAAALFVLAVLAVPSYRGLVDLPRVRTEVQGLRTANEQAENQVGSLRKELDSTRAELQQMRSSGGLVQSLALESPSRGTGSTIPTLRMASPPPTACWLTVDLVPPEAPVESLVTLEILGPGDERLWHTDVRLGDVLENIHHNTRLMLAIPTSSLKTGLHAFRVMQADNAGDHLVMQARFLVEVTFAGESPAVQR